MTKSNLK